MTTTITRTRTRTTKVAKNHEPIVNDAPKFHATFAPGDVVCQGDLYFVGIDALPASAKRTRNRQLAEGTTKGSRHVAERGTVYKCSPRELVEAVQKKCKYASLTEAYVGLAYVAPAKPTENDITHPEHGNHGFPAGTVCAIVYQRSLDAEEREQRVLD